MATLLLGCAEALLGGQSPLTCPNEPPYIGLSFFCNFRGSFLVLKILKLFSIGIPPFGGLFYEKFKFEASLNFFLFLETLRGLFWS